VLLDNDVVYKLARWDSLSYLQKAVEHDLSAIGALGSLRYVIGPRLDKLNREPARKQFQTFLESIQIVEPSDAEIELAAQIEETATLAEVEVDNGESLLIAIGVNRAIEKIATGDKRAISGIANVAKAIEEIKSLKGRLLSFEQIVAKLCFDLGFGELRSRICSDAQCDKAISICFACHREIVTDEDILACLSSYQRHLSESSDGFTSNNLCSA